MINPKFEPSSIVEQIAFLRHMYRLLRKKCYKSRFRMLLTALLSKEPTYYEPKVACLNRLMNIIENCLNRMEADRAFRYLLCLQNMIGALEKKMLSDCNKYWRYLNVATFD